MMKTNNNNKEYMERKIYELTLMLRGAAIASVFLTVVLIGLIIVANAATVNTVTVNLTNKKSATVSLKKALKKGDKITKKSVKNAECFYKIKYVSSKKIKVSVDPNSFTGNDSFKLKTKKKRIIKVKIINKDYDNDEPDNDWFSLQKYTYEANGHKMVFVSADERDAFIKIVDNLNYYLNKDLDESNAELTTKIYGEAHNFKATATPESKKASVFAMYIGSLKMRYNYDENGNPKLGEVKNPWQALLNGTYKGVCGESAERIVDIGKAAGLNVKHVVNWHFDHGWAVVESRDLNGKFWRKVVGSSAAFNIAWNDDASKWTSYDQAYEAVF